MNKVKIAAVQTLIATGEGSYEKNIKYAYDALDTANKNGADIICFPETFPGPQRVPIKYDPYGDMSDKARQIGKYVIYGTIENTENDPDKQYVTEVLLGPNGKVAGKYRRTSPPKGPWIYKAGSFWDFNYHPDTELPVFRTDLGVIGMLICSEVYVPELSRVLAIKGAEITFLPAGTYKASLLKSWEILIRARAIENLMYTVTCQNLFCGRNSGGLAMIADPEGDMVKSEIADIVYMDADLERLRWLRSAEDGLSADGVYTAEYQGKPFGSKPGIFKQWRNPDIFGDITKKV